VKACNLRYESMLVSFDRPNPTQLVLGHQFGKLWKDRSVCFFWLGVGNQKIGGGKEISVVFAGATQRKNSPGKKSVCGYWENLTT